MRTTVRLNDALYRAAKKEALARHISFTNLLEEALREKLARAGEPGEFELVTFGGGGLMPGVDITDSAGLLDLMEEE